MGTISSVQPLRLIRIYVASNNQRSKVKQCSHVQHHIARMPAHERVRDAQQPKDVP